MTFESTPPPSRLDPAELWRVFEDRTREFPDRPAVTASEGASSFHAIHAETLRLAATLEAAGITRGSIVALALPNSLHFVPALLAAWRCSATVALVSPKYRASELQAIRDGLHPTCFVMDARDRELYTELVSVGAHTQSLSADGTVTVVVPERRSPRPQSPVAADHALIKLTSGSTGVPKGIALSVPNLLAEANNIVTTFGLTSQDRTMAPVPLVHSYGFDLGVLPLIVAGVPLTVTNLFVPRRILADLSNQETTIFLGVPSMYRTLVDIPLASVPDLTHVRYLLSCTAPLHPELITAFHKRFRAVICQHYGSSETGGVTTHVPAMVLARPSSVGRFMSGVAINVVGDAGQELAPGVEGEIVIRSGAVASGYVMGAPPGDCPFRADGYRTGDLGVIDAEGFLHLTGRKGELLNVGGLKVSPSEVTRVLERHPAIQEAAVAGVQSDTGDDLVCAVVTLRTATTEEDIIAHCRNHLADYKVPRRVAIRDRLPRGPTGKVKLRAQDLGL